MSLSAEQIARYRRDGFIVVEGVLSPAEIADLRRVTDALVESARTVTAHTSVYDLEPSHTPADPRVRRIKRPHQVDPVFDRTMRHPRIVAILRDLLGPAVRWDESKLNMKSPGYGAAVEWHQDWAFYPHTNDDLCAVGVMMDDCALENGPLLIIPGSHEGPVHDHHVDGHFAGAMDPAKCDIDISSAVPCLGRAGSLATFERARPGLADRWRLLAQLPWWCRNVGIKVLLRLHLRALARGVGHHDTYDPY